MEFSEIQEVKNMVDFRSSKINEFRKEKDEDFPLIPEKRVLIEPFNKSDEELDDILKDIQTGVTQTQISELNEGKNNEKQAHFDESKPNKQFSFFIIEERLFTFKEDDQRT